MNSEVQFYKKIFSDFLPDWSERGGYIKGYRGWEYIYPKHIVPIPVEFAPTASLDGLLIDLEHSPSSPQLLSSYIQTVSPGGIAIVHLHREFWNKKMIFNTFSSSGFEILYFAAIPKIEYLHYDSGFFEVKGFLPRIFFSSFPYVPFSFRRNFFIIAKKNFYKKVKENHIPLSLILILPEEEHLAIQKLQHWDRMLKERKNTSFEIIIIARSALPEITVFEHIPGVIWVRIPEMRFFEQALYSGLYKSSGKVLAVDGSKHLLPFSQFLELLDLFLQNNTADKPFAIYVFTEKRGLKNPFRHSPPEFGIYNLKCKEIILKYHPYNLKNYPRLIEKEIARNGKILRVFRKNDYFVVKKNSLPFLQDT